MFLGNNILELYLQLILPVKVWHLVRKDHIQKLQLHLRQHRLSPISSTFYNFEDMIVHWYRDLLLEGINSPPTPLEREITTSRPMASPPSLTMHKIPLIYPIPPLSPVSGYFFNFTALRKLENTSHKDRRKSLVSPMNQEANPP